MRAILLAALFTTLGCRDAGTDTDGVPRICRSIPRRWTRRGPSMQTGLETSRDRRQTSPMTENGGIPLVQVFTKQ